MAKRRYLNFDKIKEVLDGIFDTDDYDYYRAKKTLSYATGVVYTNPDLENNPSYNVMSKLPSNYYLIVPLPSADDIEKVLKEKKDKLDPSQKKILNALVNNGLINSVAFITKSAYNKNGKKGLKYAVAVNAGWLKSGDILYEKGMSKEERREKMLEAAKYLSGVVYHEAFGHGELEHLEKDYYQEHRLANIMEDLIINTRIKADLPEAAETLRNVVGGVWRDTFLDFPETQQFFGRIQALLNPDSVLDKESAEEVKKRIDLKENKKIIIDAVKEVQNKLKTKYAVVNGKEHLEEFINKTLEKPEEFVDNYLDMLDKILKRHEKYADVNMNAVDNLVLDFLDDVNAKLRETNKDVYNSLSWESDDKKENKNFTEYETAFKQLFRDGKFKGRMTFDPNKSNEQENKQDYQDLPTEDMPGTYEDGNNAGFEEELKEDDNFAEEIDEETEKEEKKKLDEIREDTNKEINPNEKDRKSGSAGAGSGEEEIPRNRKLELKELERIFSSLIGKYILPTFKKTEKRQSKAVPGMNIDVVRQQAQAGRKSIGAPFGTPGNVYLNPDVDNFLLTLWDVSASMSKEEIGAMRNAIANLVCKRGDIAVMGVENDWAYQGLKILNPNSKDFNKQLNDWFKVKGRGGTGNFTDFIKKFFERDYRAKNNENFGQFEKDLEENIKDIVNTKDKDPLDKFYEKNDNKQVAIVTDSDTLSELTDKDFINFLKKHSNGKPLLHIFLTTTHSYEAFKKRLNKLGNPPEIMIYNLTPIIEQMK